MVFKDLGKVGGHGDEVPSRDTLYFNAFTEDLFSWDNDLENDEHRRLKLNPASRFFIGLNELEIEMRIRQLLNRYANFDFKINFEFDDRTGGIAKAEVTFSREVLSGVGDDVRVDTIDDIKISRGEKNIFIWCFFIAVLQLALGGAEAYKWVQHVYKKREGWIFLSSTEEAEQEALRPMHSLWLDLLILRLLTPPKEGQKRAWFVIDELATLQRLPQFHTALTKGRKSDNPIVFGYQGKAQ